MSFNKTFFPYFRKYCIEKYGRDNGIIIFNRAEYKLITMMKEADFRNNNYIKWHMKTNILPVIAIYLTFKEYEPFIDKAYDHTDEVLQIMRLKNRKKYHILGSLPFGYAIFRILGKSAINKQYPEQGWNKEWLRNNKEELYFNMKSCVYYETAVKYNCAEMSPLFCANDDVVLSGFKPAIIFERNGTIAKGQTICDFHFKNGKYIK